jgi:hypothetical protein
VRDAGTTAAPPKVEPIAHGSEVLASTAGRFSVRDEDQPKGMLPICKALSDRKPLQQRPEFTAGPRFQQTIQSLWRSEVGGRPDQHLEVVLTLSRMRSHTRL